MSDENGALSKLFPDDWQEGIEKITSKMTEYALLDSEDVVAVLKEGLRDGAREISKHTEESGDG